MEQRYIPFHDVECREENDEAIIEGYFAVFNSNYELWPGASESIAKGAFDSCLDQDTRALWNHNTDIVLGRTGAGTLTLQADDTGLKGRVVINKRDTEAMNGYERIKRKDVSGCSFGFEIGKQEADYRDDGTVHWTIKEVSRLYEVSPCTFPAYEQTSINARKREFDDHRSRQLEVWRNNMRSRLKGGSNGN